MDTTYCPECGVLAEVKWRAVEESTDGPVEHAKIVCAARHWFLLPVAMLEQPRPAPVGGAAGRRTGVGNAAQGSGQA